MRINHSVWKGCSREIRGKLPAARNCAGDSLAPFQEQRTGSRHLPGHMANNCASAYYFCIPHHESFKREEIKQLWQCGLLGTSNPQARLNAVFFCNGFQFCLRGGLEHRRLKLQQIKRDDMGYTYYENGSKNRKGVPLKKKHCQQGCMVWCSAQARERCHVHLLDVYLGELPKDAHRVEGFYFWSLPKPNMAHGTQQY